MRYTILLTWNYCDDTNKVHQQTRNNKTQTYFLWKLQKEFAQNQPGVVQTSRTSYSVISFRNRKSKLNEIYSTIY